MGIGTDPDFLLIQKMRMGDEKAVGSFVTKYYANIFKYCQLHIDDYGYAQDMTQETFARFFRSLKQYQHYGKAVNYLYVIASHVCTDYYRKKKVIPNEVLTDEMPDAPDTAAGDPDLRLTVQAALERLPKELRETAILYFIQEQKQKDIARILGIQLSLVKYRIRRARELLSRYLRNCKEII